MNQDILVLIQENMNTFSKGQKRIAAFILDSYDKAAFMTASRLGKKVGVSESTVVRFAAELGYDGYPDMQKSLQKMIRNRLTSVQRIEVTNDRIGDQDLVSMVLQSDMEKIRLTLEELDRSAFDNAVKAIVSAKRIYIIGVRSSAAIASFLGFYFNLIFDNVVNVTAGTASEVTRHCVLTNTETKVKFVIVSWRNLPSVSINDPLLMIGKPAALTAATGMDALTHAVEAYISKDANPVTDAAAMQAIRLIARNLRQAVALGSNLQARENMAYASLLAGMAFNNANLGYVHAMAHQLGGLYDMPHGVANAVLLPHVARYNLIANPEKFADIAELMGENITGLSTLDAAEKAIAAITRLSMDIGIPQHLRDLGVKEADFPYMAEMALKDGNAFSNPRKGNEQEIAAIFRQAF